MPKQYSQMFYELSPSTPDENYALFVYMANELRGLSSIIVNGLYEA